MFVISHLSHFFSYITLQYKSLLFTFVLGKKIVKRNSITGFIYFTCRILFKNHTN